MAKKKESENPDEFDLDKAAKKFFSQAKKLVKKEIEESYKIEVDFIEWVK